MQQITRGYTPFLDPISGSHCCRVSNFEHQMWAPRLCGHSTCTRCASAQRHGIAAKRFVSTWGARGWMSLAGFVWEFTANPHNPMILSSGFRKNTMAGVGIYHIYHWQPSFCWSCQLGSSGVILLYRMTCQAAEKGASETPHRCSKVDQQIQQIHLKPYRFRAFKHPCWEGLVILTHFHLTES